MTTLHLRKSIGPAPAGRGFLLIPLALAFACFALSPTARAEDGAVGDGSSTAEGTGALTSLTSGVDNTAIGFDALNSNTTGNHNTANGAGALFSNTSGDNTATGFVALSNNTTGNENTANGVDALFSNTTGNNNTANGSSALEF